MLGQFTHAHAYAGLLTLRTGDIGPALRTKKFFVNCTVICLEHF